MSTAASAQYTRTRIASGPAIGVAGFLSGVAISSRRVAWISAVDFDVKVWADGKTRSVVLLSALPPGQVGFSPVHHQIVGWSGDDVIVVVTYQNAGGDPGTGVFRVPSGTGTISIIDTAFGRLVTISSATVDDGSAIGLIRFDLSASPDVEESLETVVSGTRSRRQISRWRIPGDEFSLRDVTVDRSRAYFSAITTVRSVVPAVASVALYEAGGTDTARTPLVVLGNSAAGVTLCLPRALSADDDAVAYVDCAGNIFANVGGGTFKKVIEIGEPVPAIAPVGHSVPAMLRLRRGAIAWQGASGIHVKRGEVIETVFAVERDFMEFNPTLYAMDFDGTDVAYVGDQTTPMRRTEVWLATRGSLASVDAGVVADAGPGLDAGSISGADSGSSMGGADSGSLGSLDAGPVGADAGSDSGPAPKGRGGCSVHPVANEDRVSMLVTLFGALALWIARRGGGR
jgi:hypothetical protein